MRLKDESELTEERSGEEANPEEEVSAGALRVAIAFGTLNLSALSQYLNEF